MIFQKVNTGPRRKLLGLSGLACGFIAACATPDATVEDISPTDATEQVLRLLDSDSDGRVSTYEGMDGWARLVALADRDEDDSLSASEFSDLLTEQAREGEIEREQLLRELDADNDRRVSIDECPAELRAAFRRADIDGNALVDIEELAAVEIDGLEVMIASEVESIFADLDEDGDGAILLADCPPDVREEYSSCDANNDGNIVRSELAKWFATDLDGAHFAVDGSKAEMTGVIGPTTPARVLELIFEHPKVRTIVMRDVPGSMDDEANLRSARLVRRFGLATHVPSSGVVASGGTDFFLAGATRTAGPGARFGVHSWGNGEEQGADVPRDDPQHELYLSFYDEIGIDALFYWYTLEAAPADGIHWMTAVEMDRYRVLLGSESTHRESDVGSFDDVDGVGLVLDIDTSVAANGVVPLPEHTPKVLRDVFVKYTRLVAPNGKPIHFLAQDRVTDEMLVRAREVMRFYLADVPGTRFGSDKAGVANAMSDRIATLVYFNTERDAHNALRGALGDLEFFGQDLYAEESVVEGSRDYMENRVRDATLEEVFHLVHGAGIQPALPDYHARIELATRAAIREKRWFTNEEWEREGSSPHEYIISVIDVVYGLWAHDPDGNGTSFGGEYSYSTPAAAREHDALGVEVLHEFLPEQFAFDASIAASFKGTFSLNADPSAPYALKARHLVRARLTGDNTSNLEGNDHSNVLHGNSAANVIRGHGGDDLIDGGSGVDVAVFGAAKNEYDVRVEDGKVIVVDRRRDRDGVDTLMRIERLRFADCEVAVGEL